VPTPIRLAVTASNCDTQQSGGGFHLYIYMGTTCVGLPNLRDYGSKGNRGLVRHVTAVPQHTHTSQQTEMAGYPACRVDRFPGVEVAGN
jgi:hypothetical protein